MSVQEVRIIPEKFHGPIVAEVEQSEGCIQVQLHCQTCGWTSHRTSIGPVYDCQRAERRIELVKTTTKTETIPASENTVEP